MPFLTSITGISIVGNGEQHTMPQPSRGDASLLTGSVLTLSMALLTASNLAHAETAVPITAPLTTPKNKQSVAEAETTKAKATSPSSTASKNTALAPANTTTTISRSLSADSTVSRGAYIARAADCAGCHGEDYTGGVKFVLPMGTVISTNITSSKTHGIGGYTLQQFSDAVRKGRTPTHQLYPAMPYPSYSRMSDTDIADLYAFMQTVTAVDASPKEQTKMNFPFNMRLLMKGYNLINIPKWEVAPSLTERQKRGQYLVDNLGHCGDCHTPRTSTMGYDTSHYLAGTMIQGAVAPNITPDNATGIGSWSQQDIVHFLKTGELQHQALAGGEMGKVVSHSLQYLTDADLMAMADYLKTVPAVNSGATVEPLNVAKLPNNQDQDITYNLLKQIDVLKAAQSSAKPNSGEAVYLNNCASCHGITGQGQTEAAYPALTGLSMLRDSEPARLIQVIAHGSQGSLNTLPDMPAFANTLNDEQIAQVANYVRTDIGGVNASQLTADDVKKYATQQATVPFLIANAAWLTILAIIVGLVLLGWLIRLLLRRR